MMIELLKQKLTENEIRCWDCDRIMTWDEYYCRRQVDVCEVVCVDCGLKSAKFAVTAR